MQKFTKNRGYLGRTLGSIAVLIHTVDMHHHTSVADSIEIVGISVSGAVEIEADAHHLRSAIKRIRCLICRHHTLVVRTVHQRENTLEACRAGRVVTNSNRLTRGTVKEVCQGNTASALILKHLLEEAVGHILHTEIAECDVPRNRILQGAICDGFVVRGVRLKEIVP